MLEVTQDFIDAFESPVRKSRMSGKFGIMEDLGAGQPDAIININTPTLSYNTVAAYDGGLPLTGDVAVVEGWSSPIYTYDLIFDVLADESGLYNPALTYSFTAYTEGYGLIITFDPLRKEYADSFSVTYNIPSGDPVTYNFQGNKMKTLVVPMPSFGVNSILLTITKWSHPYSRARIKSMQVMKSEQAYIFTEDDLIDFSATHESDSRIERFVTSTSRLRLFDKEKALCSKNVVGLYANLLISCRKQFEFPQNIGMGYFVKSQKWENNILTLELENSLSRLAGVDISPSVNDYTEITAEEYYNKLTPCFPDEIYSEHDTFPTDNLCCAASSTALTVCLMYLAEWACLPITADILTGLIRLKSLPSEGTGIEVTDNHYLAPATVEVSQGIGGVDVAIYKYEFETESVSLCTQIVTVLWTSRYYIKFPKPAKNVTYITANPLNNITINKVEVNGTDGITFYLSGIGLIQIDLFGCPLKDPTKTYYSIDAAVPNPSANRLTIENPLVIDTASAARIAQYKLNRYAEQSRIKTTVPGRMDLELLDLYSVTTPENEKATARLEKSQITIDSSGLKMAQEAVS